MTRQEEADEIIKIMKETNGPWPRSVISFVNIYSTKYLKPKDPLFEKLYRFIKETKAMSYDIEVKDVYPLFKEIFAEELNGTKGLEEAIETAGHLGTVGERITIDILKEIKERMEK